MRKKAHTKSITNYGEIYHNSLEQLLPRQKPQIASIPGVPANTRRRYQVSVGDSIIASGLTADDALEVAANCMAVGEVDA